jgi:type IV secretion system protein VirB1
VAGVSALSLPVVLALAATCQHVVAPATIAGIARHESAFDPRAIHKNNDGSIDAGLMQINSANWGWLGLTAETALDPCQSIRAAGSLLASYSRFNTGSPIAGVRNGYVAAVTASITSVKSTGRSATSPPAAPQDVAIEDGPADPSGETSFIGD